MELGSCALGACLRAGRRKGIIAGTLGKRPCGVLVDIRLRDFACNYGDIRDNCGILGDVERRAALSLTQSKIKELESKEFDKLYEDHKAVWDGLAANAAKYAKAHITGGNDPRPDDTLKMLLPMIESLDELRDHQDDKKARAKRFVSYFGGNCERQREDQTCKTVCGRTVEGDQTTWHVGEEADAGEIQRDGREGRERNCLRVSPRYCNSSRRLQM